MCVSVSEPNQAATYLDGFVARARHDLGAVKLHTQYGGLVPSATVNSIEYGWRRRLKRSIIKHF